MRFSLKSLILLTGLAATIVCAAGPTTPSVRMIEAEADREAAIWSGTARRHSSKLYLEAAENWRSLGSPTDAGRCFRLAARQEMVLADSRRAAELLHRALDQRPSDDAPGRSITLSLLAQVELRSGNLNKSKAYLNEAQRLSSNDAEALATYAFSAGDYHYSRRSLDVSGRFYEEAVAKWRSIGRKAEEGEALIGLAYTRMTMGEPGQGLMIAKQAEAIFADLNYPREMARSRIAIGAMQSVLDRKQMALDAYRQAETGFPDDVDLIERGRLFNGIGLIHEDLGDWSRSLAYRQKALDQFKKASYPYGQMATLPSLVRLNYLVGDPAAAVERFDETIGLSRLLNEDLFVAAGLQYTGDYQSEIGDDDGAIKSYESSLNILRRHNAKYHVALLQSNLGDIYKRQGKFEKSRQLLDTALRSNRLVSSPIAEAQTLFSLAALDNLEGNSDAALQRITKSISITEELYSDVASSILRQAYLANSFDRYELYIDLLMRRAENSGDRGPIVSALQAAERSRAQAILADLRFSEALGSSVLDAAPELARRENEIRAALNLKRDLLTNALSVKAPKDEVASLESSIEELEDDLERVRVELKRSSPVYSAIKAPPAFDVEAFQANILDDRSVLLEYSLGNERSYLWLVDKANVTAFILPGRAAIETKVENLRELLASRVPRPDESADAQQARIADADAKYWPEAHELSRMLLGQALEQIQDKRLIVVPDGKLHYLPFSALPMPGAPGNVPIVMTNEVVYQPSAQTLSLLTRPGLGNAVDNRRDLLILSDPVFAKDDSRLSEMTVSGAEKPRTDSFRFVESLSSLPRLPGSKAEASAILDIVGASSADSLSGFTANRERLLGSDLTKYKILHFATHGIVSNTRPDLSGIVLSRFDPQGEPTNEFIRLQDIYGLKLNADLVVLSACDTGTGKEIKGEGIISLNTAFLQTGARSVMASLWKVEDSATEKLMKAFYAEMARNGSTPSEALRQAQISLANDPRYASPFYWAAFTLQGDLNVRPNIGHSMMFPWWLAVIPALVGLFWVQKRLRRSH